METASSLQERLNYKAAPLLSNKIFQFFSYAVARRLRLQKVRRQLDVDLEVIKQSLFNPVELPEILTDKASKHLNYRLVLPYVISLTKKHLEVEPYDEQVEAALAMLQGSLVEVETGEGKTLSLAMAAATAAYLGQKVHVITSNDYLVERDLESNLPLFRALGLTGASITAKTDFRQRQLSYQANIIYSTAKELAADFLRDQVSLRQIKKNRYSLYVNHLVGVDRQSVDHVIQSARDLLLIDEVDSCLIDEAVTPLILSRKVDNTEFVTLAKQIWELSTHIPEKLYKVNAKFKKCLITGDLKKFILDEQPAFLEGKKPGQLKEIMALIPTALEAQHLYKKKIDYNVTNGKIVIIDQSSGRLMDNRTWSKGLHQFIEMKESIVSQSESVTEEKITFQNYFRSYAHLSGASGTVLEERKEIWQFYQKPLLKIQRHFPSRRVNGGCFVEEDQVAKKRKLLEIVKAKYKANQPILIGCSSVESSLELQRFLQFNGISANVLNADSEAEEAHIISNAGGAGVVTIGTQMVGRGTDIKLDPISRSAGGLCTILYEYNSNTRIDRQFFGRSARQNDPGERMIVTSVAENFTSGSWCNSLLSKLYKVGLLRGLVGQLTVLKVKFQQKAQMRKNRQSRYALNQEDERLSLKLSYLRDFG